MKPSSAPSVIGLLGDGAQADECEEFATEEVRFRAVSAAYLDASRPELIELSNVPVRFQSVQVVAAVGAPAVRRELVRQWPGDMFATIISPQAIVSSTATVAHGSIVAPGSVVSARASIGSHVLVNIGSTISHDVVLGDYSTISPGANLGGRVSIGAGVFVGIGAAISNDVSVVSGAIIGAGAVVVENLDIQGVYVGVPARLIRQTKDWLRDI